MFISIGVEKWLTKSSTPHDKKKKERKKKPLKLGIELAQFEKSVSIKNPQLT